MELHSFDSGYLERLTSGDAEVERHFTKYFSELILIKLRSRRYSLTAIEDIRQETFLRVLQAVRRKAIRDPERIGSYVNSVCNNVALEFGRKEARLAPMDESAPETPDARADSERDLMSREEQEEVRTVLSRLTDKNRRLLSAVFLEERSSEEVCGQFGVDQNYLRVLLFRARAQFRQAMEKRRPGRGGKTS